MPECLFFDKLRFFDYLEVYFLVKDLLFVFENSWLIFLFMFVSTPREFILAAFQVWILVETVQIWMLTRDSVCFWLVSLPFKNFISSKL